MIRLAIGHDPDVGRDARVLEHVQRQRDDRFQPVVLDQPTPDVAFPLTGVPGEQGRAVKSNDSSSKLGECLIAFTPKGLRHLAQGCSRSELPWVDEIDRISTPMGLRPTRFPGGTPLG